MTATININALVELLQKDFPNAKYIASDEPLVEDDMIELTDKKHVQICQGGGFAFVEESGNGFLFTDCETVWDLVKASKGIA